MKKFLKIRKFVFLIVLLFLTLEVSVSASDFNFYKQVLGISGFEIFKPLKNKINLQNQIETQRYIIDQIVNVNENLLLITSENSIDEFIEVIYKKKSNNLFIVCDSDLKITDVFQCNNKSFQYLGSKYFIPKTITLDKERNINIYLLRNDKFNILIFNQVLFESSKNINLLEKYLIAIKKSSKVGIEHSDTSNQYFKDRISVFLKSTTFQLTLYLLFGLVLTSFFIKIIVYLKKVIKKEKKFDLKEFVLNLDDLLFGVFAKNIYTKVFYIFCLISSILVLFYFLNFPDFTFKSFFEKNVYKINNFDFYQLFLKIEYINFFLFSYLSLTFFLIIISRIQSVLDIFQFFLNKIKQKELNIPFSKNLFVLLYLTSILLFIIYIKFGFLEIIYQTTLLTLFLTVFLFKQKIDLIYIFSLREKLIISLVSIFIIPFILIYLFYFYEPSIKYEDLINVKDSIVILPYKKHLEENTLIKELDMSNYIFLNYPLYIDDYLIFHPNKTKIVNRSIEKYEEDIHTFYVIGESEDKIIKALLKKNLIQNSISENSDFDFIFVKESEISNHNLHLELNIDCSLKDNFTELSIDLYYLESDNFISSKNNKLGNILGCKGESSLYFFKFPEVNNREFVFKFKNVPIGLIKDINLFYYGSENTPFSKGFDIKKGFYYYITGNISDTNEVHNYFIADKKSFNFESSKIHVNINKLLLEEGISNYFNIWSKNSLEIINFKN